jgi:hypothetical protein
MPGKAFARQLTFLVLSRDPARDRTLRIPTWFGMSMFKGAAIAL